MKAMRVAPWLALALGLSSVAVAVPPTSTYVGELTAENGLPYTGEVAVKVHVFSGASGGSALATQDLGAVWVEGGVLSASLEALAMPAAASNTLWLEFEIDGETLSPRQQVTSTPYAQRAKTADMLGGHPASAFVMTSDGIPNSSLPTNALSQVSNNAISNEFSEISWTWAGGPANILDFPGVGVQASITTNETGTSYLTSLSIYTQFQLIANSRVTVVLVPPAGSGVGPITLIDDSVKLNSGTYANLWTPGNVPQLAPLINKEVKGTWFVTITDTEDDLAGTAKVGELQSFTVEYDVVRSDEIKVAGDATVEGDLTVNGMIHGGGVTRSGAVFTHWGAATCPVGSELVFGGWGYTNYHTHSGSGEVLCLAANDPGTTATGSSTAGYDLLYTARISNTNGNVPGIGSGNLTNLKCSLCYVPEKGPCFDLWGTSTCPTGWAASYTGYGFGSHYQHNLAATRICVDTVNFDASGSSGDQGAYLYPMSVWGSTAAQGSGYPTQRTVKCAQCCRQ